MTDADLAEIPVPSPAENNDSKSSCMVCYNFFHSKNRVPKILPCGHSFCQECIQGLIANAPQFIRSLPCPTCRKNCTYENPANPIASIPTNFVLREVLEKQEENDITQGKKYGCRHCRMEFHEKDLMKCDTCCPKVRPDDSVDFMGRANLLLSCSDCMDRHHHGHLFQSITAVASRWRYRSLFEKFAKSVENEEKRVEKFIDSMSTAIEVAKKFKLNLRETAHQVQKNHGHNKISSVLRNFMRASNEAAKFVNMSTQCMERFAKPDAPQNSMLGKELFKFAREPQAQQRTDYAQSLSTLFKESDRSTPLPAEQNGMPPDRVARMTPVAPAVPIEPVVPVHPAIPGMDVQNLLVNFLNPNYPARINWNVAPQNILGAFQPYNNAMVRVQQFQQVQPAPQVYFAQPVNPNAGFQNHNMEPVLGQGGQVFQNVLERRETTVQEYFEFPINILNPARPEQVTLREVVHRIISNLPPEDAWAEVYRFFFLPPYDNNHFSARARICICAVLRTILDGDLLVRGVMPYSGFERQYAALHAYNDQEDRMDGVRNPIGVDAVPVNQDVHDVVVLGDDDDDDDDFDFRVHVDDVHVHADDDDEDVLIIEENRAGVPVFQVIEDGNNEQVQERNVDEIAEIVAGEVREDDQQDEDLLPRHRPTGHVFEAADFVMPTPAQSTRSARKRTAPAVNAKEHQSDDEEEAGTSATVRNRRSGRRTRRAKRGRRA